MKKYIYISFLITLLFGCEQGFDELNVNPNDPSLDTVDPIVLFSKTQKNATFTAHLHQRIHNLSVDVFSQYYNSGPWSIARGSVNDGFATDLWRDYYRWVRTIVIIMEKSQGNPDRENLYQIARIWRVWMDHRATDLFGYIPYFGAGNGKTSPPYDSQEEIYTDMLKQLKEAVDGLNDSQISIESYDFVYNGNLDMWRRFGNSLRLRLAMRISERNPILAKQHAEEAVAGGVFEENAHNAEMQNWEQGWGEGYSTKYYFDWGPGNGCGMSTSMYNFLVGLGGTPFPDASFFADQFVGENKQLNLVPVLSDPRGPYFFGITDQNGGVVNEGFHGNWTAKQVGMSADDYQQEENFIANNSRVGPAMHKDIKRPLQLMTASEVFFLRCEGLTKDWNMEGTLNELYEKGIRSSMEMWGIEKSVVDAYLLSTSQNNNGTTVPLDNNSGSNDTQLDKIILQKYIAGFPDNGWEAWADYRRIQKPLLIGIDAPDPGTGLNKGDIVQRLRYPILEENTNNVEYEKAVKAQGADLASTKVWWAGGN